MYAKSEYKQTQDTDIFDCFVFFDLFDVEFALDNDLLVCLLFLPFCNFILETKKTF